MHSVHISAYHSIILNVSFLTAFILFQRINSLTLDSQLLATIHGKYAAVAKSPQLCPTLCDPIDGSPSGSPVPGILQARTLEWVAISFSKCLKLKSESEVAQSCPTLSDPMDCSLPGSSIHGIFQARVLEWGATAFSIYGKYRHQ